jgi:hypothetical protein
MARSTYTVQLSTDDWAKERGYWQYASQHNESGYFDTREQALESLFCPVGHGGYRIGWYGDGFVLCAACARAEFEQREEDGEPFTLESQLEDGDNYDGIYCDNGCEIIAPHCVDCADDLTDVEYGVFWNQSGDRPICGECLAKLVVQGAAQKTGRRTYTIPRDAKATTSVGITYGLWFDNDTYSAA